jgi:hypothetical protein
MKLRSLLVVCAMALTVACANVDVTKTGKGFHEPTNPAQVEILKTVPDSTYDELGTVTVSGFDSDESAKMHNAIRSKAAGLGANAVILTEEGLVPRGFGRYDRWGTGVAIRYQ